MNKGDFLLAQAMMALALNNSTNIANMEVVKRQDKTPVIPKGLKEFRYGDNIIYAINQNNADRKARKAGFIK
ncbi:MAG: hypothetical protein BGO29_14880 [Bacteroidales bacterium 36-12]|nr:MAG: hypothetical protein BGO29_14880 [Bacteroidales bacterium 36-12]